MGVLCEKIEVNVQSELLLFNLRVFTFFKWVGLLKIISKLENVYTFSLNFLFKSSPVNLDVLFIVFNSGCYDYQFAMNQRSLTF